MLDMIHSFREAITLPPWGLALAVGFIFLSPLMIVQWRRGRTWHKSDE